MKNWLSAEEISRLFCENGISMTPEEAKMYFLMYPGEGGEESHEDVPEGGRVEKRRFLIFRRGGKETNRRRGL